MTDLRLCTTSLAAAATDGVRQQRVELKGLVQTVLS